MAGVVATDITSNSSIDIPTGDEPVDESRFPTTSAEDAARIILDGIESDDLHIYAARDSRLMNLASRVALGTAAHLIYRQMKNLLPS